MAEGSYPPYSPPSNWSICCLVSLAELVIAPHMCAILLDDIMDVHKSSLRTLMYFYVTSCQVYWGLTYDKVLGLYSDLISHTHTHIYTQRHTAHPGASRLTHRYKYIFTPTVMCSQQLSLLHWMKKSLVSKIFFPQCLFFSKIIHLQKSYLLIRCYSHNRNGVNKQKAHTRTPSTQRKVTLERVS